MSMRSAPSPKQENIAFSLIGGVREDISGLLAKSFPSAKIIVGLDEGLALLPGSGLRRLVLVTPRPEVDLAKALTGRGEPEELFSQWSEQLRQLLNRLRRHRRTVTIMFEDVLAAHPRACIAAIAPGAKTASVEPLAPAPLDQTVLIVAQEMLRRTPTVQALVEEFTVTAFAPEEAGEAFLADPATALVHHMTLLRDRTRFSEVEARVKDLNSQHRHLTDECDICKAQLQLVSSELQGVLITLSDARSRASANEQQFKAKIKDLDAQQNHYVQELKQSRSKIEDLTKQLNASPKSDKSEKDFQSKLAEITADRDRNAQALQASQAKIDSLTRQLYESEHRWHESGRKHDGRTDFPAPFG